MAQVSQGFFMTVTLGDVGRQSFTRSYELRSTVADFTAALVAATNILTDLAAVTECSVIGYVVAEKYQDGAAGFPTNPVAERQNNALVDVAIEAAPLKTATLSIPGPIDAMFNAAPGFKGYDDVDGANGLLIAFMDNFKEAGGEFSISDGEQIADTGSFKAGSRVHRASRKG